MVANIFLQTPPLPPPTLVVGSKGQHSFFQNMVMLHIKLKLVTHVATWKQIFYLQPPPPSSLGVESQGQKIYFSQNMVMLHIKLTGIRNAWYFAHIPLPWGGVKRSNANVSEYGHVAYQIKGNDACSNMVANILPADPARLWGSGQKVKIQLFQNMVMLHIKLNGITNAVTW